MATTSATVPTRSVSPPWLVPGALVAAAGGAFALTVCNALVGFAPGQDAVESTADQVRFVAQNAALVEVSAAVGIVAVLLIVPGIWAVAARLAPRSPRLSAIGAWAMASGYVCSIALSVDTLGTLAIARSGLDAATYGAAVDGQTSPVSIGLYTVFGVGALAGGIVLGVAVLRQRGAVPAWLGWLLIAAAPVRMVGLMTGIQIGPPLASLCITIAFAGVILSSRRAPGASAGPGAVGSPAAGR